MSVDQTARKSRNPVIIMVSTHYSSAEKWQSPVQSVNYFWKFGVWRSVGSQSQITVIKPSRLSIKATECKTSNFIPSVCGRLLVLQWQTFTFYHHGICKNTRRWHFPGLRKSEIFIHLTTHSSHWLKTNQGSVMLMDLHWLQCSVSQIFQTSRGDGGQLSGWGWSEEGERETYRGGGQVRRGSYHKYNWLWLTLAELYGWRRSKMRETSCSRTLRSWENWAGGKCSEGENILYKIL